MPIDLGALSIDSVIVHEVPERRVTGPSTAPFLSETESPLTITLRNYIREKISGSLATASYDVVFDVNAASPIFRLTEDHLGPQSTAFVAMSQQMATHLHACQTGVNPAGLLVVSAVTVDGQRALTILKLEKESGVRVREARTQDGKRTLSMEHIRELMLTDKTRVFKVGLFYRTPDRTLEGLVSDKQRGYVPQTEIADFFLKKFLGCVLKQLPSVVTRDFLQATEQFINDEVSTPSTKARYQIALLAELQSGRGTIQPREFAEQHFNVGDRRPYIDYLERAGVPDRVFDKDTTLVGSHLEKIQLDFESGLIMIGSLDSMQHVHMRQVESDRTHVEFEDKMRRIQGRGRKKRRRND